MKSKDLQSNFTNLEQSKQLLELGLSSLTADCCITLKPDHTPKVNVLNNLYNERYLTIPCWSVGRLIEIYSLATGVEYTKIGISEISLTDLMIKLIEVAVKLKTFDFSKLEKFSKLELD